MTRRKNRITAKSAASRPASHAHVDSRHHGLGFIVVDSALPKKLKWSPGISVKRTVKLSGPELSYFRDTKDAFVAATERLSLQNDNPKRATIERPRRGRRPT